MMPRFCLGFFVPEENHPVYVMPYQGSFFENKCGLNGASKRRPYIDKQKNSPDLYLICVVGYFLDISGFMPPPT